MPNKRLQFPMPSKITSLATILCAGLIAVGLDITAAFAVYGFFGLKPMRLLQGIAGGLLGPRTFEGGLATAFLGLLCQFLSAFSVAAVYFAMSRGLPFLVEHAVISGFVYGAAVYFFMNRIVVPLSAATKYPFSFNMMFNAFATHIFSVVLRLPPRRPS